MTNHIAWRPAFLCALYTVFHTLSNTFAQSPETWAPEASRQAAAKQINDASLRAHIRFLASDLLEGRGPGSRGDQLAQQYIAAQFQALGFEPGGQDGSWYQRVPLVGVTTHNPKQLVFEHGQDQLTLKYFDDFVLNSGKPVAATSLKSAELVFVGYGITAPEYQWDDYKGADLRGKIVVMMNNDPSGDPELFAGKRRLYYGRWDYKYASAAAQGAAGALIIHTEESAGYPYQVVQTSWTGEEFELPASQDARVDVRGWLTNDAAKRLFALSGFELDTLRAAAERRDFQPVALSTKVTIDVTATVREQETGNVLAKLPGTDPELKDQTVIFMAHHDHLGLAETRDANGDNIYNGAIDNASGSAALLTIAQACSRLPHATRRTLLFAAVGAEEQGLLGSEYFAHHPPQPAEQYAAVINIDGINFLGKTHDVTLIGGGKSDLDSHVNEVALWQHRIVTQDHFPDRGTYYRSDQFSLAKVGVPGVYLHSGLEVIGKPSGWAREQINAWVASTYHQPSDEYREDWNLDGAVEDVQLLFQVGLRVADQTDMPKWRPGDEFERRRSLRRSEEK